MLFLKKILTIAKAPHIQEVDGYIKKVIKSSLTDNEETDTIKQATELAQDFISGNAVSQEKISKNIGSTYSAKEQIFEYYFAKALANIAVDAIVLKNEDLVTISQRLMKGHVDTGILPEMISVSIDIFKDRLAVEKDELAIFAPSRTGQRSLSIPTKRNIVNAMASLPNPTREHIQYLTASISDMDKFATGNRKLKM